MKRVTQVSRWQTPGVSTSESSTIWAPPAPKARGSGHDRTRIRQATVRQKVVGETGTQAAQSLLPVTVSSDPPGGEPHHHQTATFDGLDRSMSFDVATFAEVALRLVVAVL